MRDLGRTVRAGVFAAMRILGPQHDEACFLLVRHVAALCRHHMHAGEVAPVLAEKCVHTPSSCPSVGMVKPAKHRRGLDCACDRASRMRWIGDTLA